jgi:hypothetical protein
MTKDFDIKVYDINFESVFIKPEIEKAFFEFLETENNIEPFLCLKEIERIEKLEKIEDILESLKKMKDVYLSESSDSEVNISGKTKSEFLQKISQIETEKEWKFEETPVELMIPIKNCLTASLAVDNFPRFIRLLTTETLYSKYQNDTNVMIPRSIIQFPYKNSFFEEKIIGDDVLKFAKVLSKDSYDWEIILSKKDPHFKLYKAKVDFLPFASLFKNAYAFKIQNVVPLSIESLCCFFFLHRRFEIEEQCDHFYINKGKTYSNEKLKEMYPDVEMKHERICSEFEVVFENIYLISNRKFLVIEFIDYDTENKSVTYVHRACIPEEFHQKEDIDWSKQVEFDLKGKKSKGYVIPSFFYINLEKIDDHTTKVNQIKSEKRFCSKTLPVVNPRGKFSNQNNLVTLGTALFGNLISKKLVCFKDVDETKNHKIFSEEFKKDPLTASLLNLMIKEDILVN